MNIQNAESNIQLVSAYKSAKFAMDSVMGDISVDQVDDVILSIQESIENQQQIQSAMNINEMDDLFDNEKLEKELADLMKDETIKVEEDNTKIVEDEKLEENNNTHPTVDKEIEDLIEKTSKLEVPNEPLESKYEEKEKEKEKEKQPVVEEGIL